MWYRQVAQGKTASQKYLLKTFFGAHSNTLFDILRLKIAQKRFIQIQLFNLSQHPMRRKKRKTFEEERMYSGTRNTDEEHTFVFVRCDMRKKQMEKVLALREEHGPTWRFFVKLRCKNQQTWI